MGNCLLVKATSSLSQTSVMNWILELWVLIVPSDFADLGQKRWEKIDIDAVVAACWNKVSVELPNYRRVFVPDCFVLLPCPFLQLAKEIINENRVRVFSEHQSPKDNERRRLFLGVTRNASGVFSAWSGFSLSSICIYATVKHLGRVIENPAGDGCQERVSIAAKLIQKAYSYDGKKGT